MFTQATGKQQETIEVEDDDAHLQRISERVLEKLDTSSPAVGPSLESIMSGVNASEPGPANERSLNELLARVQAFLPQIEASNAALEEKDPHSLDIENTDGDDKIIQMFGTGSFQGPHSSSESDDEEDIDSSADEDDAVEEDEGKSSSTDTSSSDDFSSSEQESSLDFTGFGVTKAPPK